MCFLIENRSYKPLLMVCYIIFGFILFTNMYDAQTIKTIKNALIFCPTIKQFEANIYFPFLPFVQFCDVVKVASIHKKI